jgi:hypothetical protein
MSPLPFTREQFFEVFRAYNEAVWPAQWPLLTLAAAALLLTARPRPAWGPIVSAILGLLWIWAGLAYHLAFFATINPLAFGFAALSVAGGVVFLWQGVVQRRLVFRCSTSFRSLAGLALVAYALLGYPGWLLLDGHRWPALVTFGLPCPTTLFTLGMLAMVVPPVPRSVWIVPLLWCAVGVQAAWWLRVTPDLALGIAAVLGLGWMWRRVPAARQ